MNTQASQPQPVAAPSATQSTPANTPAPVANEDVYQVAQLGYN